MNNDIGSLIVSSPGIRHGRPCIAGTGITVHRIAIWYKLGHGPEEIARRYGHLSEAQVYAALAYYHANRDQIEAELAEEEGEADAIERQHTKERQTVWIRSVCISTKMLWMPCSFRPYRFGA